MNKLVSLYRKYMPIGLRYNLSKIRLNKINKNIYRRVCDGEWDDEHKLECDYMREKKRIKSIPYKWIEEYNYNKIDVLIDSDNAMPYVLVDCKRLYFPKRYPIDYIKKYFTTLLIEQDIRSPHFYFSPDDERLKDVSFVDIGAAEGYISLKIIDNARKVIIFESDFDWIEALNMTFKPYGDKVSIINLYASDVSNSDSAKIDDIVSDTNVALKIDVEGMEMCVLKGAERVLTNNDTKVFLCTYHRPNDYSDLCLFLQQKEFIIETSDNFMFYGYDDIGFRKGVIRSWSKN